MDPHSFLKTVSYRLTISAARSWTALTKIWHLKWNSCLRLKCFSVFYESFNDSIDWPSYLCICPWFAKHNTTYSPYELPLPTFLGSTEILLAHYSYLGTWPLRMLTRSCLGALEPNKSRSNFLTSEKLLRHFLLLWERAL